MGPAAGTRGQVEWFAFVARAYLTSDAADLLRRAAELRNLAAPGTLPERLLADMEAALRSDAAALANEFARLFLDPAGAPCPPWQSLYSDDHRLMGAAHRSALAWYRAAGMELRNPAEPADHVGLLLAFYSRLLAGGSTPEIAGAFFEEHLQWLPPYCALLAAAARHPFYSALAAATRTLLDEQAPGD